MWLPNSIIAEVEAVATIRYYSAEDCARWNKHRHQDEIRLFSGYGWISKDRQTQRQGFKTLSVAYRDAYYALVLKQAAPNVVRLKVVRNARAA